MRTGSRFKWFRKMLSRTPVMSSHVPRGTRAPRLKTTVADNRLTGGHEVVTLNRRQFFTSQEDSWYSFLSETE
jgi:hypothetical protein